MIIKNSLYNTENTENMYNTENTENMSQSIDNYDVLLSASSKTSW